MAGSYPNAPSRKMNHYSDGTILLLAGAHEVSSGQVAHPAGLLAEYTGTTQHLDICDHDTVNVFGANGAHISSLVFIFPELRDIDGTYTNATGYNVGAIVHSSDTTNGIDGTWTTQTSTIGDFEKTSNEVPGYRTDIYGWSATNVRGLVVMCQKTGATFSDYVRGQEIYGSIAAGQTPDRVLFINDATGLEYVIPQDFGDVPRGSSRDIMMRMKNNSGTKVASSITVSKENLESGQDSSSWYTFDNGGGFAGSFQIPSLGTGAEDSFTLRQNIPDSTVVGLYESWAKAVVGSWA